MQNEEKYIEIDLMQLLSVLWRKAWILALTAVIGAVLTLGYTKLFITPLYEASAMLYINNSKGTTSSETITQSDLVASQSLVDTYVVILNSQTVIDEVIKETGADYKVSEVKEMLSASAVNSTEVLKVSVRSSDPKEAQQLTNTFVDISSAKMSEIVDSSSVKIVDYASEPLSAAYPNVLKNTLIGFLLGLLISGAVIVLRELTDTVVRSENRLAELFPDIPILGVIPSMNQKKGMGYGGYAYAMKLQSYRSGVAENEAQRDDGNDRRQETE